MPLIPAIPSAVLANARQVWNESIDKFGRPVTLSTNPGPGSSWDLGVTWDGGEYWDAEPEVVLNIKAFCKRPKILGLFDRTEQSFDQERYMVLVRADDLASIDPEKFDRIRWDDEDHVVLSTTQVDLQGTVFGYRFMTKG